MYQHQQDIIKDDPNYTGLFLGVGSGKTRIALSLAKGKTLVIAPKTQVEDRNWQRELKKIGLKLNLTVISKERFRRDWDKIAYFDTVIGEECHTLLGVTPNTRWRNKIEIPKTSQLFEALEEYLAKHNPKRFYLVTATIMRSPMTVWGAATLLGYDWDFYDFRKTFYTKLPIPGREIWVVKNDSATKDRLAAAVRKIGYVGRLDSFFDVPEQTFKTIEIGLTEKQKKRIKDMDLEYPDPIVKIGKVHQIENGGLSGDEFTKPEIFNNEKYERISDLATTYPKMIIIAKYRAQINDLAMGLLRERYNVETMTGDTKNRGEVLKRVNESKECIFIVQAQISSGWEWKDCPVMVFASMSYSFVDRIQAEGRIQRSDNIKKNLYIDLVVKGGVDEAVYKAIANKKDFDSLIYIKEKL